MLHEWAPLSVSRIVGSQPTGCGCGLRIQSSRLGMLLRREDEEASGGHVEASVEVRRKMVRGMLSAVSPRSP